MMQHYAFCRLCYVLFYQLTLGLAFYSTSNSRLQLPSWKCRGTRHDYSLTMRTLLIDNFDSYTYNIWQLLSEVNGEEPIVVYNNAFDYNWDELLLKLPEFDNIVISPGPGSPDVAADFGICKDAILRSNLPVLGVCLGHQGIAHSFGGIVQRAKIPMHGRLSSVSHTNTGLFEHIPQDTKVVRYHSLVVDDNSLPSELIATAWTSDNVMMGLQHVSKPIYGVQFHPESISTSCGKQLFINFKNLSEKYHKDRNNLLQKESQTVSKISAAHLTKIKVDKKSRRADIMAANKSRHILIAKKTYDKSIDIKKIFEEIYGESKASFWLDSSSFGPVQGRIDNSTPLSFFGDLDSSEDSYAIEYYGSNKLIKRTTNKNNIENINQNIFEFLDVELEKNKNVSDTIYFNEIPSGVNPADPTTLTTQIIENNKGIIHSNSNKNTNENTNDHQNVKKISLPFNVTSAYFGFLGYEARHEATEILTLPYLNTYEKYNLSATHRDGFESSKWKNNLKHPMAFFMCPEQYIVYDHRENSVYVVSQVRHSRHEGIQERSKYESKNQSENRYRNAIGNNIQHDNQVVHKIEYNSIENDVQNAQIKALELLKKIDYVVLSGRPVSHENLESSATKAASSTFSSISESTTNVNKNDILYAVKSKEQYRKDIKQCLEYIKAGESYEICLTLQFQGQRDTELEPKSESKIENEKESKSESVKKDTKIMPLSVYENLRNKNPAPYSCFLYYDPIEFMKSPPPTTSSGTYTSENPIIDSTCDPRSDSNLVTDPSSDPCFGWYKPGGFTICSSSPERYLKATKDGIIESKPIKGTARRNLLNSELDNEIAQTLKNDEKSQAENLMVVDLVRNDFGRVCEIGSVTVPQLMRIETFASVHQLVSTIRGKLQPGRSLMDAVVATFPGGSMTGAPKLRTMNIIEEIENRPRGIYSGAIGFIGLNGESDLNIVIRTAILSGGTVTVGSGGAIVALSLPDEEVDEVILKAQAVSRPLGYSLSFNDCNDHIDNSSIKNISDGESESGSEMKMETIKGLR